jgi:hypothetical protein
MESNGAIRIPITGDRAAMPAYGSLQQQWQGLTSSERIKKTLFLVSVVSAGLYYLFIGLILLARYFG